MRFGEIKSSLFNINQQLLVKLLKQLEKDKLIKKKEFKGFPKKVVFSEKDLKPVISSCLKFIYNFLSIFFLNSL